MKVLSMLLFTLSLYAQQTQGSLSGSIIDQNGDPIYAVTLTLENNLFSRTITVDRDYELSKIPIGTYRVTFQASGFAPFSRDGVVIKSGEVTTQNVQLETQSLSLRDRVVAPSSFAILSKPETATQYLDRDTVRRLPRLGDDILRSLDTLPGTSSNDFGSAFNIRGGEFRETLFNLDGMELYDPFHLKDYAGVFSFLDGEAIGGIELNTGGFDATYGNAMSGVLNVNSVEPVERASSASISFGGLQYQTEGTFNNGLTSYVFSGRRGYLDLLLSLAGDEEEEEGVTEDNDITYYDSFGKISHAFSNGNKLSFHYLLANDKFLSQETGGLETEDVDSSYDDLYLWTNLDTPISDTLTARTTLFSTSIDRDRNALSIGGDSDEDYLIDDLRTFDSQGIKTQFEYARDTFFLRFGGEYRQGDASYDYTSNIVNGYVIGGVGEQNIDLNRDVDGNSYNAFLTGRFMVSPKLTAEVGVRYDHQEWLDDSQVSPRLNLSYEIDDRQTLRFAYGTFSQGERLNELQIADGSDTFSQPETATHYLIGYETTLPGNINFRTEAYYKDLKDLRTRYANLTKSLVFYPGLSGDRVAIEADTGKIYGAEILLKKDQGQRLSWFFNYAYQKAEDTLKDGRTLTRPWEQEHTLNLSANYRLGRKWNFNLSWIYHTGWRTTPFELQVNDGEAELVPGEWFSDSFPAYHRMDLRINRSVFSRGKRSFELFIDISNLYNRKNVRGYEEVEIYEGTNGPELYLSEDTWLPILPSFGVNWRF